MQNKKEIETYHDRIRETVVAHLAAGTLKTHHGRLAVTLETSGKADPETLAVHFRGAEDPEKAGHYYALAADKAAEALAFVRAAGLYRLSLDLRPLEEAAAREMRLKLGDALANAGHGPEAAREYQAASLGADADERLDLQRRAAYQYLISGHFDEGHAALETVLRAVDMKLPATPRRALLSLIAHRAWLRIRGLGFRKRDAAQIPAAELRRLDICWSTSIGLAIIDIIRAADFQTRGMLLALKAGDPLRIIRALAIEAIHMAAGGGRTRRRTATLLGETEKLAQQLAHPYAEGVATLAQGAVAWLQGNHRTGWQLSAQAEEIFRNRCTGIAWELDAAQLYWLLSLVYLGEYAELSRLAPGMLKEAQERGDLFAATSLNAFMMPNLLLGADNPDGARQTTRAALAKWSQHGFHTQHLLALVSEVEVDLYRGEGAAAWARLKSHWPAYTGSLMTRVQHPHIQVLYSRARSALAAAASAGDPAALLRSAAKDARRLEREKMPWSLALAGLIRAGLAAARGDLDGSRARLAQAIPDLDRVEMGLQAAAARRRLGHLLGGDEGRTLVDQADARMAAQGIRNPARMTAALAPGFPA